VLVCLVPTALATDPRDDPLRAVLDGPARRRLPVAVVQVGQQVPVGYLRGDDGGQLPGYAEPRSAAAALAHARDRARWLAEPPSPEAAAGSGDPTKARRLVDAFLAAHPTGGWLDPDLTARLLECYRLPLTEQVWAPDEHGALDAARSLRRLGHGGAVALKAYWTDQVHKSASGAVRIGLADEGAVRAAYRGFTKRFGDRMTGAVVQPMAAPGLELLAGVAQDEVFGPLVVLGLGGTATGVLDDRSARLAPLTERDLDTMVSDLRAAPLLLGHPGSPPVDRAALRKVLAGLSRMAADLPQLAEADLNPLIVRPDGAVCVDARIRLEPRPSFVPYLRRLRRPGRTRSPE
jgi:acyl-CoA synthetase (NDP forming)